VVFALSGVVGRLAGVRGTAFVADRGEIGCALLEDVGRLFVGDARGGPGPILRRFGVAFGRLGGAGCVVCLSGIVAVSEAALCVSGAGSR
jgi:hypothetical protein